MRKSIFMKCLFTSIFFVFSCITIFGQTDTTVVLEMNKETGIIKFQVGENIEIKQVATLLMKENIDINKFEPELGYLVTTERKVTKKLNCYYVMRITLIGNELSIRGYITKPLFESSEMSDRNLVKPIGMKGSPQKVVSDEIIEFATRMSGLVNID